MKRLVSIMVTSILIMTCMAAAIPYSTYAESYKVTNDEGKTITRFGYDIIDGNAEITDVSEIRTDELVFPSHIDGYPVKAVRGIYFDTNPAFRNKLKTIQFEDGIEIIDNCGFDRVEHLTKVILPKTLKGGKFCFDNCEKLESITIPGTLEEIPEGCFEQCDNLIDIKIENGVQAIGENAFRACGELESITIPDSVLYIKKFAFGNCNKLKNIFLSENLNTIGDYAFFHSGLENVELPSRLTEIGEQAFASTPLKSIILPDSMKSIGYGAFKLCNNLTKLYIPKGIKKNPNEAWYGCEALTDITIDGGMTKELYNHLVLCTPWGKEYDKNVTDDFVIFDDNYLSKYKGKDKNPIIPDKITALSERAFENTYIDSVTFSPNIKEIPSLCFSGSHIKTLVIPSTVKTVQDRAFYWCSELENIIVEDGVESIGSNAFQGCKELTEINIGKSVHVSPDAFSGTPLDSQYGIDEPTKDTPQATATPMPTAAPEQKTLTVQGGEEIEISVDGKAAEFDAKPFIDDNGRTQVPVRAVSELVNCKVDWNQESQTAVIEKDNGDTVKITLGSDIMLMNDNQIKMDTAAQIKDDRTYIPVRFVAEALGLTVNWIE